MKKLTMMTLTSLVLLALAVPALAFGPLDVDAGVALNGKYVWRGMVMTPDPVLQPSVGVNALGFGAGFWGNIDLNDVNGQESEFGEIYWTLAYEIGVPLVNFGAGFIHYTFPASDIDRTTEFYVGAALNVLLSPKLTVYQDLDAYKGAYWEAQVSHGVALSPATSLDLTVGLGLGSQGYIEGYFGPATLLPNVPELPGNASMTDFFVSAGVPFHPAPMFTVTPSVSYNSLTGDVKDIVDGAGGGAYHGESYAFIWGVNASFSF